MAESTTTCGEVKVLLLKEGSMAVLELGQKREKLSGCAAIRRRGRRCAWRYAEGSRLGLEMRLHRGVVCHGQGEEGGGLVMRSGVLAAGCVGRRL